jgi:hypothetical protein
MKRPSLFGSLSRVPQLSFDIGDGFATDSLIGLPTFEESYVIVLIVKETVSLLLELLWTLSGGCFNADSVLGGVCSDFVPSDCSLPWEYAEYLWVRRKVDRILLIITMQS